MSRMSMARYDESLIFEQGKPGRVGMDLPDVDLPDGLVPPNLKRDCELNLPEVSEIEVIRHYFKLSQMTYGVDTGIYPLGSCTMKYNPKFTENLARWGSVCDIHPYQDESAIQGSLQMMFELQGMLGEVGGCEAVTLQPAAGAAGEWTGLMICRAYYAKNGQDRDEVILPDSAHGTNPASVIMAGYKVVEIKSREDGCVDLEALEAALSEKTAAFMITNPSTLGVFEHDILEIARIVHDAGALLYYDGANLNAIMGKVRPGDMGFDIVHFNLHKTFSTPHGGGGPGSGPIGVKTHLKDYLPVPVAAKRDDGTFYLNYDLPDTIGKVKGFYGNYNVCAKAHAYIKLMGGDGLTKISEVATLNCNYMKERLLEKFDMPFKRLRKHEFVLSGSKQKAEGKRTLDMAKRLMDYGFHGSTVYFPLIVEEAMMVEPTESEPKEELDAFCDALLKIADEPADLVTDTPKTTPVSRIDEVYAARTLILSYRHYLNETRADE